MMELFPAGRMDDVNAFILEKELNSVIYMHDTLPIFKARERSLAFSFLNSVFTIYVSFSHIQLQVIQHVIARSVPWRC